jgi:Spy/CpxP family protein refolding chaperone
MLRNIKSLLAIAFVTVAVGAVTIPNLVSAENTTQNTSQTHKPHRGEGLAKKLNLTEAQKTQMKAIHESAKARRDNVFTAEQRAIMAKARETGDRKGVRKQLNLTDAQKQQLRAIGAESKTQIKAILTPEQKQQLEQIEKQHQQKRQQQRQERRSNPTS